VSGIRAVGFDLGETLLTYADTPLSWSDLYGAALREAGRAVGVEPTVDQISKAEAVLAGFNTRLKPRAKEVPAEEIFKSVFESWRLEPRAFDPAVEAFFQFFQQRLMAYEDSRLTVDELLNVGLKIGVLTDVPYGMPRAFVERDLDQSGLGDLKSVLLTSVETGYRKPASTGFIALAALLGVQPREMVYVGNESKDIAGANAAGMISVLIDRDGKRPDFGQRYTVTRLLDVVDASSE